MIYCFSGTGNSAYVARYLSQALHETLHPITWNSLPSEEDLKTQSCLGLICPVYAWGVPYVVEHFIHNLPRPISGQQPYTFAILTCGDDIGRTDDILRRLLLQRGRKIDAIFSLQMRNTYVGLPGFDVDSDETVTRKAQHIRQELPHITQRIIHRAATTRDDVTPGSLPGIKSYILRPIFNALLCRECYFHVDAQRCIHCGRCIRNCPLHNLTATREGIPRWLGHCTLCFGCYHSCPTHAINHAFFTKSKGQVNIIPTSAQAETAPSPKYRS